MIDLARLILKQHEEPTSPCALCVVAHHKGQRPLVTVYFPERVYTRLSDGMQSLLSDSRGNWLVDSRRTSVRHIKDWLMRYDAWDTVRDAETVVFGDAWKSDAEWRYYLARAS